MIFRTLAPILSYFIRFFSKKKVLYGDAGRGEVGSLGSNWERAPLRECDARAKNQGGNAPQNPLKRAELKSCDIAR